MAELVDALDSKSSDCKIVPVQARPRVPKRSLSRALFLYLAVSFFQCMTDKQKRYDRAYLRMALEWSKLSHCERKQVGALIVKDRMIISDGYNGCPSGFENECEDAQGNTKWYVLHAEANAISKTASSTHNCKGATLYLTMSPCKDCSKLVHQAGITRLVFLDKYKDTSGIDFLAKAGVEVVHFTDLDNE